MNNGINEEEKGQVLFYQTDQGRFRLECRLECRFEGESLWLSLNQIAELFERDKSVISKHLKSIYEEGELLREATVAKYATVQSEGGREINRQIEYYNLDAIIAVGYRVRSNRGIQFRQLLANGWLLGKPENYNRELALYAEDLLGFVKDTQDAQWQKFYTLYSNNPEQKFLERVATQLNKADPNAANTELRVFASRGKH